MKRNYFLFCLTLIFALVSFTGCKKVKTPNKESKQLFGKWELVKHIPNKYFPGPSGHTSIEIKRNGTYIERDGDKEIFRCKYKFYTEECPFNKGNDHNCIALIDENDMYDLISFNISGKTLSLKDEHPDGDSGVYEKK